jgi:class 3 adenylate cyclase
MDRIKVLFLAANPVGTPALRLDEEIREIQAKLRAAEHRDLELISRMAVGPDDLQQALLEHRPHVVHFSGHGSRAEKIALEAGDGTAKPVSKTALVRLFQVLKDNVRVILLNACYSRPQAEAITQVIDCAIGMNEAIGDRAAITFAASFYRALGFGRSVKEAFELGRAALLLEDSPEANTPELLIRSGVDPAAITLVGTPPPAAPAAPGVDQANAEKVIVVVDLSRYSDIARQLEQHFGAHTVRELNTQIQGLITGALESVGVPVHELPYKGTGDGAIVTLGTPEQASRFAEALHHAARTHNWGKEVPLAQRHFRIGVWTGQVQLDRRATADGRFVGFEMAGTAIANAVQLEGACRTGEVLISPDTWVALPKAMRREYGGQEEVKGKRGERFRAHRRKVVEPAPWDVGEPLPQERKGYSGVVKVGVCSRLVHDWRALADILEIPEVDRSAFTQGRKPHGVWEWLERRGKLGELERALAAIGREDLVEMLRQDPQ